jgi:hypothetical protein
MIPNAMARGPRPAKTIQKTRAAPARSRKTGRTVAPGPGEAASEQPATGLAADYLDQFDRAIMLLQSLAATPDCAGDFHAWRPRTYPDHVESTKGEERDAIMAAYAAADPRARERFEALAASMADVLVATQEVMQASPPSPAIGMLANRAALWVGKLVAQARAVAEDTEAQIDIDEGAAVRTGSDR